MIIREIFTPRSLTTGEEEIPTIRETIKIGPTIMTLLTQVLNMAMTTMSEEDTKEVINSLVEGPDLADPREEVGVASAGKIETWIHTLIDWKEERGR